MDIILIPGMWLTGAVWADTVAELERLGHRGIPLAGAGEEPAVRTLDALVDSVVAAIEAADHPVVIGHSAASSLAWMAADRCPELVERVVLIGGFPDADGRTYFDAFAIVDQAMPFPGWEPFDGPDAADLDDATRQRIARDTIAVPESITAGSVRLSDRRRHRIPVTVICPEFTADDAKGWVTAGDVPELAAASRLDYVDIDSGHWPMVSCPRALAGVLAELADRR